jgi:hypothetical protein
MELEDEIWARIRAAKSLDPNIKPEDFQIRAGENGSVLINLKTGRAQLIYDDESKLHDLEDLSIPRGQEDESGPSRLLNK